MSTRALIERCIRDRKAGRNVAPVVRPGTLTPLPVTYRYGVPSTAYAAGHHTGEDYACPVGSLAIAPSWGTVVFAGNASERWGAAYGLQVIVRMADGTHDYGFCHLSRTSVKAGDTVEPGTVVGLTGNTGNSTGPHLHFEARTPGGKYGTDVDPVRVRIDATLPTPEADPEPNPEPDKGPEARPRPTRPLAFVSHNVYVGNKALRQNIAQMLRRTGEPVAATLQEASRVTGGVPGYKWLSAADDPNPDVPTAPRADLLSNGVLLRDDAEVLHVHARQVPNGGWSWTRGRRVARVWVRVVYRLDGVIREVWSIHRCPGGPVPGIIGNRVAWQAEHRFLVDWVRAVLDKHPDRHLELGGDWNAWLSKDPGHPCSIRSLAKALGARANLRHIDGFLSINAPAGGKVPGSKRPKVVERVIAVVRKLAGKFGSDGHRPVLLAYKPQPPPRTK